MKYHYKASFTEPGSADLVYARLRQRFPQLSIYISESDYPQESQRISHIADHTDTEFGSELSFALLAPINANNLTPSEQITQNNTGITPSPYGAIQPLLKQKKIVPDPGIHAVIYGTCDSSLKPTLSQHLRNYGAENILFSKNEP